MYFPGHEQVKPNFGGRVICPSNWNSLYDTVKLKYYLNEKTKLLTLNEVFEIQSASYCMSFSRKYLLNKIYRYGKFTLNITDLICYRYMKIS